jgi:hypothetical protein
MIQTRPGDGDISRWTLFYVDCQRKIALKRRCVKKKWGPAARDGGAGRYRLETGGSRNKKAQPVLGLLHSKKF